MSVIAFRLARRGGLDAVTADVAAFLHTPIDTVRKLPVSLLLRMHHQAERIARLIVPRG